MSSQDLNGQDRGADLRHIRTWMFDLDNTLYPVSSGFMDVIVKRMTRYVMKVTGLEHDAALVLQKRYLAEHGLTLRGLMLNHGVDPDDYHTMFHDLSLENLTHDPILLMELERLPGRKVIFTNADELHARRVMAHLGLDKLFDDVFHIGSFDFIPKPSIDPFRRMVAEHAMDPATTAFFEDTARNLEPAAQLGMTTVLVGPAAAASAAPYVQYRAENLAAFLHDAKLKEAA
jgi:putative hydrolase of the HAD superfamily